MTGPEIAALRGLYGRPSADRIAELIEANDANAAALQTLRTNPTPEAAERIANQIHGMHRSASQLVTVLAQEVAE